MNKDQFAYLNENIVALEAECDRLRAEVERLKACPICHRPFIGKEPHSNCGDTIGPGQQSEGMWGKP